MSIQTHVTYPSPRTIWLTGLSGAGKSTLAQAFTAYLAQRGIHPVCLDGDELRRGLNSDLGFTETDRSENIRRVAEMARLLNEAGLWVIVSLISPVATDRAHARNIVGALRFSLVWVHAPLSVCEARDPKGLYAKARAGALPMFTGIDAPYEQPTDACAVLQTDDATVEDCVQTLSEACGVGVPDLSLDDWLQRIVQRGICAPGHIAQAMIDDGHDPAHAHVLAINAWIRHGPQPLDSAFSEERDRLMAYRLRRYLAPLLYDAPAPAPAPASATPLPGLWDPTLESGHTFHVGGRWVRLAMVCEHPRLALLEDLLSPQECARLIDAAKPVLVPDEVVDDDSAVPHVDAAVRSSQGCELDAEAFPWLRPILKRIRTLVGWPQSHWETLTISRYPVGAHFEPHYDYFGGSSTLSRDQLVAQGGDRIATLVMYLNDVCAGGDTFFPELHLRVRPRCGSAVFFTYRRPDGTPDPASLHAGQPVHRGEKWIATLWLRERALNETPTTVDDSAVMAA